MPLILIGARQVGKIWLLREFGKARFENVVELNFDEHEDYKQIFDQNYDTARILRQISAFTGAPIAPERTLLIFDEIQECPRALTSLKYFCERAPEYAIAAAGSLLGLTVDRKGGTGFPVGKVTRVPLNPLSFREYLDALGRKSLREIVDVGDPSDLKVFAQELLLLMREYFVVGGMPRAVASYIRTQSFMEARSIQRDLAADYEDDISKHLDGADRIHAIEAWRAIPQQLSKQNKRFIYREVARGGRGAYYRDGIEWLCKAGITTRVSRVARHDAPLAGYEDREAYKLFLLDVGLLGALCDLDPKVVIDREEIFSVYNGAMTEQYVCQQMLAEFAITPYYWAASDSKAENDFMMQRGNAIYAIEVKGGNVIASHSMRSIKERFPWLRMVRLSSRDYVDQGWMRNIPLYALASQSLWEGWRGERDAKQEEPELTERQKALLNALEADPSATYGELSASLGVGKSTLANELAYLRSVHIIERIGTRRSGHWRVYH